MTSNEGPPIFIVGAPRGGTTLLRVLLNRHPAFGLCDETYYFYWVAGRSRTFGDLARPENRERAVDRFLETDRIRRLGLDPDGLRSSLLEHGTSYAALFRALMDFYARAHGKRRSGEKTPHHALLVEQLRAWYPHCSILHVVRDPRDVVTSLLGVPWGGRDAVTCAREWARCVAAAHSLEGGPDYLVVRYESLVRDPEAELTRVCDFVGEPFSGTALVPGEESETDRWWFDRAQGPITTSRVGLWKTKLSAPQISLVEWVTGDLMEEMGYERAAGDPSAARVVAARLRSSVNGVHSRLRRLPSLWYHWFRPSQLAREEYWIDRR